MKAKVLFCLSFLLISLHCTPPTNIMQASYTFQLPDGTGVNATTNLTAFASTSDGVLTFSDKDGDVLTFTITGLAAGQSFSMGNGNTLTGTFNVVDQNAQTQATVQDTGTGFFTVNSMTGSGTSITAISGTFRINIENQVDTTSTTPVAPTGAGTIQGSFNYVGASAS